MTINMQLRRLGCEIRLTAAILLFRLIVWVLPEGDPEAVQMLRVVHLAVTGSAK